MQVLVEVPAEGAATVEDARLSPAAAPLAEGRGELTALALWLLAERAEARAFLCTMWCHGGRGGAVAARLMQGKSACCWAYHILRNYVFLHVASLLGTSTFSHTRHIAGMRAVMLPEDPCARVARRHRCWQRCRLSPPAGGSVPISWQKCSCIRCTGLAVQGSPKWAPLLATLPEAVETPVLWPAEERAALLRGSPVHSLLPSSRLPLCPAYL
jgi:hypothetical protein